MNLEGNLGHREGQNEDKVIQGHQGIKCNFSRKKKKIQHAHKIHFRLQGRSKSGHGHVKSFGKNFQKAYLLPKIVIYPPCT